MPILRSLSSPPVIAPSTLVVALVRLLSPRDRPAFCSQYPWHAPLERLLIHKNPPLPAQEGPPHPRPAWPARSLRSSKGILQDRIRTPVLALTLYRDPWNFFLGLARPNSGA